MHRGLFGGPETISCPSCHWIGGPNGAGAETDNAFLVYLMSLRRAPRVMVP